MRIHKNTMLFLSAVFWVGVPFFIGYWTFAAVMLNLHVCVWFFHRIDVKLNTLLDHHGTEEDSVVTPFPRRK